MICQYQECRCRSLEIGNMAIDSKNYAELFHAFRVTCGFVSSRFAQHVDAATAFLISEIDRKITDFTNLNVMYTRFVIVFSFAGEK